MFCSRCGNAIPADSGFCTVCGQSAATRVLPSSATPAASTSPIGSAAPPGTSGKAIASLVLGIFSLAVLAAIPAIVFGHIALSEIKRSAGRLQGKGVAIAGLVLGYFGIAVLPFTLIIAAIAIPNLLRARIAANESRAVSGLRTLKVAEVTYTELHQEAGFTSSLSDLPYAGLIGTRLSNGRKNGYVFVLQGCAPPAQGGPKVKYQAVAYPAAHNRSGVRAFCSDESGTIKFDTGGSPHNCLESGSDL